MNEYVRKRHFELYMASQQYEKALKESEKFKDKGSPFYLQDMAKLYNAMKNYEQAMQYIERAISIEKHTEYKSSFLHDKAVILNGMDNSLCIEVLQEAIDMRGTEDIIDEWSKEIKEWKEIYSHHLT